MGFATIGLFLALNVAFWVFVWRKVRVIVANHIALIKSEGLALVEGPSGQYALVRYANIADLSNKINEIALHFEITSQTFPVLPYEN